MPNQNHEDIPCQTLLTTREAAELLRRSPQTLRVWAMKESGPIFPVRTRPNAPLLWRRTDIEALINVGAPRW
jgi:hypothetical protein